MGLRKLKNAIKWSHQRAKGKLPECDAWDYKYTLADNIKQGLEQVLDQKWGNDKIRKELQFVLDWAKDFPAYEMAVVVTDEDEKAYQQKEYDGWCMVITLEESKVFDKRTEKAFKLLAKNIHALWI